MIKKNSKSKNEKYSKNRVHTGIQKFDSLIQGGFKKNTTNLIVGGTGSGKTIFALQYLYSGIKKYKENGLYITFEEKKEKLYDDMKELGWDLKKLEEDDNFFFLEYTPEQVKNILIEGGGFVESMIQKKKIKRIVIDSISSFALLYRDELTRKEAALSLIDMINNWGCTAVLTSQEESNNNMFVSASLEFEVDSIVILYNTKKNGERIRAMEILKMRGTKHTTRTFKFEITDNGFKLHLKNKVNF